MDRKHIVGLRLGILLFFAMLTVAVFSGSAEMVYAISSVDEAEIKDRIIRFMYEPYDEDIHCGIDVSDMALDVSEEDSIKLYISSIKNELDYYWLAGADVTVGADGIEFVTLIPKNEYLTEAGIDFEAAKEGWREETFKKIDAKILEFANCEYTGVYPVIYDLKIPESEASELISYAKNLLRKKEYYWIESIDNYRYSSGYVYSILFTPREEYLKEDRTFDVEAAAKDWQLFQDRIAKGELKQVIREKMYEVTEVFDVPHSSSGFYVEFAYLNLSEEQMYAVRQYIGVLEEYPGLYWIDNTMKDGECGIWLFGKEDYIKSDGTVDLEKSIVDCIELATDIKSLDMQIDEEMSDLEKVLAVHEWIVRECEYDYENYIKGTIPDESYSMSGLINNGIAVYNAYALTMEYLLGKYGVECYVTTSVRDMRHGWNIVKVDGIYYHIDATWDDKGKDDNDEGEAYHQYFLKSDEEFLDLKYTGWNAKKTCDVSGSYEGYIFRNNYSSVNSYNYYDGYWYYISDAKDVVKSKIDGSEYDIFIDYEENVVNAFIYKYKFYIATTTKVYKVDMETGNSEVIFNLEESSIGTSIVEFTIKQKRIKIDGNIGSVSIDLQTSGDIAFENENVTVEVTKFTDLILNISGVSEKDIVWISGNSDIATVDNKGRIKGIKEGTVIIYAAVDDKFVQCEVNVIPRAKLQVVIDSEKNEFCIDDTMIFTATAQGGSEEYTYSFLMYNIDGDYWYRFTSFDEMNTFSWKASAVGKKVFYVEVKDSEGTVVRSEGFAVEVADNLRVNLIADKDEVYKGQNITFTAVAKGGDGEYTYSFIMYNEATGSWYRFGDFAENTDINWQVAGDRIFYVEVKDATGNVVRSEGFAVTAKTSDLSVTISANAQGIIKDSILALTATASGGSGDYTYSFLAYNEGTQMWYRFSDFETLDRMGWIASTTDRRQFYVEVKDSTGIIVRSEGITVNVLESSDLEVNLTISKENVTAGEKIEATAMATGGSGEYTYSFLIYNGVTGNWARLTDFTSINTTSWTASGSGIREFYVDVKDSNGTVVRSAVKSVTIK